MPFFKLDSALSWSSIFSSFSDVWSSVTGFVAGEPLLVALIAVPLAVGFIAIIMKVFR